MPESRISPTASQSNLSAAHLMNVPTTAAFGRCTLWFYPASFMWQRTQALHRRAQAVMSDRMHLSPAAAAAAYENAILSALGQFTAIADVHRMKFFDHLLDAVEKSRSFQGLATPFLSGLNTAGLLHDKQRIARATALWKQYGSTAANGPKLTRGFLIDTGAKTLTPISANAINQMSPQGPKASLLIDGSINHLALQIAGAGILDGGIAADGDACKGAYKLIFGIIGAAAGGSASGAATLGVGSPAGAAIGFGAGAAAGDIVGDFACGHSSVDAGQYGAGGASSQGTTTTEADAGTVGQTETGSTETQQTQTSSETSQTTSTDSTQSTSESTSSASGSDGNSNDSSGSSGDTSGSGGMPNPDDPKGFPNPDDPRGTVAHSATYLLSANAAVTVTRNAIGVWTLTGAPQLNANMQIQTAGLLGSMAAWQGLAGASHLAVDTVGLTATLGKTAGILGSTVSVPKLPNTSGIGGH